MADYNIFEVLKDITDRKIELDFSQGEVRKAYEPWLVSRYVSMCESYIPIVNEINKVASTVPVESHYRFYQDMLPKRHVFFRYIKRDKDLSLEDKKYICQYYECSMKEAEEYLKILTEPQIQTILVKYKYGNNKKISV